MNKPATSETTIFIVCLCTPSICVAEVMDKEPSFLAVWAWGIIGSLVGLFVTKYRWWLALLSLPLPLIFYYKMIFIELADEYVGAAIKNEAGLSYVYSVYIGLALVLLSHLAGLGWGIKEKKRESKIAL